MLQFITKHIGTGRAMSEEFDVYSRLSTRSRRAFERFDKPYRPRGDLLERLHRETGMSFDDIRKQIANERDRLKRMMYP